MFATAARHRLPGSAARAWLEAVHALRSRPLLAPIQTPAMRPALPPHPPPGSELAGVRNRGKFVATLQMTVPIGMVSVPWAWPQLAWPHARQGRPVACACGVLALPWGLLWAGSRPATASRKHPIPSSRLLPSHNPVCAQILATALVMILENTIDAQGMLVYGW